MGLSQELCRSVTNSHYLALAIAWDGDVEVEDGSGVPATVIFALLAPPLVASRPLLPLPATTLVWLQPSREFINVLIHLQFFPRFFQDGELWHATFRTTCLVDRASSRRGAFTGSRRPQSPPCAAIFCLCPSPLLGSPPPPSSIVGHGSLLVKATLVLLCWPISRRTSSAFS